VPVASALSGSPEPTRPQDGRRSGGAWLGRHFILGHRERPDRFIV